MAKQHDRFVSDLDQFLQHFDATHPERSAAQQQEITKHQRVAELRDKIQPKDEEKIWENF